MREIVLLRELLRVAQITLMERLDGQETPDPQALITRLFETGKICGMSAKDVAQALLEPLKAHLRTELKSS